MNTHLCEFIPERYATLTHCWGDPSRPPLKTDKASLQERLKEIPLNSMPANFRDAVSVTRALGLRYLWIDSLCIIQDDKHDWQRESASMASIYRCAYITLCALQGNSSFSGFLDKRFLTPSVEIAYRSSLCCEISGTYFIRENSNRKNSFHTGFKPLTSSSWMHRGWTLQETVLSQRKLLFTDSMVFFICGKRCRQENGDDTFSPLRLHWPEASVTKSGTQYEVEEWKDSWNRIVEKYSGRIFTFPEDKLPALSALAEDIAFATRDQYLARLWESDIHQGLLWLDIPPHISLGDDACMKACRTRPFTAPSWSWA
ncbi:uncharacterized protein K452DRAFT_275190, partial [Aplosporella prunicola CBS 121167]